MRRRVALHLHATALKLYPEIAVAVRNAIILELAAQHQAQTTLEQHRQHAAQAAQRQ
jgi:hypothetical protein